MALRSRAPHTDPLVSCPHPDLRRSGLVRPLDTHLDISSASRRGGPSHHLPRPGWVRELISNLELRGEDANGAGGSGGGIPGSWGWTGLAFFPGRGLAIRRHAPSLAQ